MKKTLIIVSAMILMLHLQARNQILNFRFDFEYPTILEIPQGVLIKYHDCPLLGIPNSPNLPHYGVQVLLPQSHEIESITISNISYYDTLEAVSIVMTPYSIPISSTNRIHFKHGVNCSPSSDISSSTIISNIRTGFLCGHSIGSFTICPVNYNDHSQDAYLIESIEIQIVTSSSVKGQQSQRFLRQTPSVIKRVSNLVINPQTINQYSYSPRNYEEEYDLLIVTNEIFVNSLQEFVEYKNSVGYYTKVVTVEEDSDPFEILYFIQSCYEENGIEYVLLIGDGDGNSTGYNFIPAYEFECIVQTEMGDVEDLVPGDIFYSDLDIENRGYNEVYVGRLSVDNVIELDNIIDKTLLYEQSPVISDLQKVLLIGGYIQEANNNYQGDDYKEEIIGECSNQYLTTGIPETFQFTKRYYETQNIYYEYIMDDFNEEGYGLNLINICGHGNNFKDFALEIDISMVNEYNFTNNGLERGFPICYSQACYTGAFDNRNEYMIYLDDDCISEEFNTIATGTVGYIANSRYGWFTQVVPPEPLQGASQHYDREFFDAIFGEELYIIGDAFTDQKEDVIPYIGQGDGTYDWCFHTINLFCDPTLDVWTDVPAEIIVNHPTSIYSNENSITFQILNSWSNERIALSQNGVPVGRSIVDEDGYATIVFIGYLSCDYDLDYSIIGHNKIRKEGTIEVVPFYVTISGICYIEEPQNPKANVYLSMEVPFQEYITDESGEYEFSVCYGWSGTVLVKDLEFPNWPFIPSSRDYYELTSSVEDHDYIHYYLKWDGLEETTGNQATPAKNSDLEEVLSFNIMDPIPNPCIKGTTVRIFGNFFGTSLNMYLLDRYGVLVQEKYFDGNNSEISINTLGLEKGVYFIRIESGITKPKVKKLIII